MRTLLFHRAAALLATLPLQPLPRRGRSISLAACKPTGSVPKGFVDWPFGYHELLELEIEDLTNLGDGVARVQLPASSAATEDDVVVVGGGASAATKDDGGGDGGASSSAGWVVMVPFALPGEKVLARVFKNNKGFSQADLIELREGSPQRRQPACPSFGECGGCQYQHLEYAAQLEIKRDQVRELLRRIGGLGHLALDELVLPAIGSPREYNYRSKLTPHWGNRPEKDGTRPIGFLKHGSELRRLSNRYMRYIRACVIRQ